MSNTTEDWATPGLKEAPFWREGMTVEEYEKERDYLHNDFDMLLKGTYEPLWKQAEKKK